MFTLKFGWRRAEAMREDPIPGIVVAIEASEVLELEARETPMEAGIMPGCRKLPVVEGGVGPSTGIDSVVAGSYVGSGNSESADTDPRACPSGDDCSDLAWRTAPNSGIPLGIV